MQPSFLISDMGLCGKNRGWHLAIVLSLLEDDTDDGAAECSPMTHRQSCLVTNPK